MRSLPAALAFTAAVLASSSTVVSLEGTKTVPMPFAECLSIIAEVSRETGVAPATLVSTGDRRTVRINAADGFVTVSCSRAEGTMTLGRTGPSAAAGPTVTASR